ncbi:hypothetical protein ACRYCC_12530 [Actinomadura scrupuli]|uniref:hypothetical protein n=1 Tax=Actinomadura scrupuli TaxID=559629 RepID=UPI003D99E3FA
MAGSPEVLEVRLRPGAPGLRKLLTGVITAGASVLFIVGGAAHPTGFGGILFILLGAAGLALCAAGALVFAGQATGRRPVLELDDQGVRVPAVWPRSRRADRLLPWSELAAVCAWSQGPPSGGRRDTLFPQRLAFLPADPPGALPADGQAADGQAAGGPGGGGERPTSPGNGRQGRTPPENGAELLAIKVADVACVPTLRWSVLIRPGWDTTVEEIAKAVQSHRDDVPFIDRRDRPELRRKRRPATGRPGTGKAAGGKSATGQSTTGKPSGDRPATGKPAMGKPATGKPATGKRAIGKPADGDSGAGKPSNGKAASGDSGTGRPASGGGPAAPDEP